MFGVMEGGQMAGAMSVIPSIHQPPGLLSWIIYATFQALIPINFFIISPMCSNFCQFFFNG